MVIQLGVTRLKKTRSRISSPRLVCGKGEKGWCDLVCGAPVDGRANANLC